MREDRDETRVVFSGDLGRYDPVLARDPEGAPNTDYLVMESTYGNREHPDQAVALPEREDAQPAVAVVAPPDVAPVPGREAVAMALLHQLFPDRSIEVVRAVSYDAARRAFGHTLVLEVRVEGMRVTPGGVWIEGDVWPERTSRLYLRMNSWLCSLSDRYWSFGR